MGTHILVLYLTVINVRPIMFLFAILDVTDDDLLVKSKYIWIKSEISNDDV